MSASRPLLPLLAALVAGVAAMAGAHAQVPLQTTVPFSPSGAVSSQMPFGTPTPFGTPSSAAGAHHGGLRSLDLNGDRMLSRQEAQSHKHLARRFDSIDTNRDGELTRDELRAWHAAHPKGEHAGANRSATNFDAVGND
jgi:hypothetical protein